jgi:hypothetical protein
MESLSGIIVYEYEFIQNLAKSFSAELDEETLENLLEIKRTNKFIRRRSPLRLSYKVTAADTWRKAREEVGNQTENNIKLLITNLNKLSEINYPQIATKVIDIYSSLSDYEEIGLFINSLCAKASTENIYCGLYAKLINDISNSNPEISDKTINVVLEFCNNFFDKFNETVVEELQNVTDYEKLCDIMKAKSMLIGGYIFIANLYKYKIVSYDTVNKNYQSLINLTNKAPKDLVGKYIDAIISILTNCGSSLQNNYPDDFKSNFMEICYELSNKESNLLPKYKFKIMDIIDKYENNWTSSDSDWNKV